MAADGSVIIETRVNDQNVEVTFKDIQNSAKRMSTFIEGAEEKTRIAVQKQIDTFSKLNNQYALQEKKVNELKQKVADYGQQKISTEEYKEIQAQISKASVKLDELTGKQERFLATGGSKDSRTYKNMQYDIEELTNTVAIAKGELEDLENTGKAFTSGIDTEQAQNAISNLEREEAKLIDMGNRLNTSFDSVKRKVVDTVMRTLDEKAKKMDKTFSQSAENINEFNHTTSESAQYVGMLKSAFLGLKMAIRAPVSLMQKFGTALKERGPQIAAAGVRSLNAAFKKLGRIVNNLFKKFMKLTSGAIVGGLKKLSSGIFGINKSANKSTSALGNMTKALKTILKYTVGIRSLYILVNKIRSAIVEGFKNLAQYSDSTNASISMLMSSMTRLKNSLATAFNPILQVAAPALTKLIDLCSKAATSVGMFFAALSGQKTFTRAKAVNQDYAKSLESTSTSTNKAAKAAEKQTKALQKAQKAAKGDVAEFDELNIMQKNTADTASDLADTVSDNGISPSDMFEDVPIESKIKDLANKLKKYIKSEDWKGLGEYIAKQLNKGLKKVYDAINWKNAGPKITKFCKAFTESFNSLVDNLDWDLLGRTIGAGINTLVRTFNLLFGPDGIDFENLGKKFSTGLRGMLDEVSWTELGNALGNKFMILWKTLEGFVDDMSTKNQEGLTGWQQLGDAIADTLNGTFDRISFKDMAHTVATGINGVFAALQKAVDEFNWEEFTQNIKDGISEFLQTTDWQANGKALGDFIKHLCETIRGVMTKENFKELGEGIGQFLSELPWEEMLTTAAGAIMDALSGLLEGLSETSAGKVAAALAAALIGTKVVSIVAGAFSTLFGKSIASGIGTALGGTLLKGGLLAGAGFGGFKFGEWLSTKFFGGEKKSASEFVEDNIIGYQKGDITGAINEWFKDVFGGVKLSDADLQVYQQWEDAIMIMVKTADITGQQGYQLLTYMDSFKNGGESTSLAILEMKNKMDDLGISTKTFEEALNGTAQSTENLKNSTETATEKTQGFSQAMQETDTSTLIEKLNSLRYASDKVSFADLILKSADAIDQMGGIWENGKQILGEKALAIHNEIVNNGLNPDKDGFYTLANGQMVQYGQGIKDYESTLKQQTKDTLDSSVIASIQEALPEQEKIGGDTGNHFIEGYTAALIGNNRVKTAYKDALDGIDTTSAKEKAKSDGEELAKNTGSGFKKGMEAVSAEVTESVNNMLEDDVKDPVKKSLDIHSPSGWFAQMATYCGQGFGNKLEVAFASTFDFFRNFRTRINNNIGSLYTIGYNVMVGMNNGMVAGASVMYNNAKIITSNVSNIFRNAWKIHSPSRVAGEIGGYFMEGMYNKMEEWSNKILNMLGNFGNSVTNGMKLDIPELKVPVSLTLPKSNLQSYMPVMASGTIVPPKTSYTKKTDTQELEEMIQKVMMSLPSNNTKTDDSGIVQSLKEAISGMTVTTDGRIIGYLQEKNQQDLNRGGTGLFPSYA